jgi:hypothetical protein
LNPFNKILGPVLSIDLLHFLVQFDMFPSSDLLFIVFFLLSFFIGDWWKLISFLHLTKACSYSSANNALSSIIKFSGAYTMVDSHTNTKSETFFLLIHPKYLRNLWLRQNYHFSTHILIKRLSIFLGFDSSPKIFPQINHSSTYTTKTYPNPPSISTSFPWHIPFFYHFAYWEIHQS